MSCSEKKFSVAANKIIFDSGKIIEFKYDIGEALPCSSVIVVMLSVPLKAMFNENVYGVSFEGNILWQVPKKKHVYADSPYTGLGYQGDRVVLNNWDGLELVMNPITGEILEEGYGK